MKTILADSGPLYALADVSDQYHSRANRELGVTTARGLSIAVSYTTLCETYTLVLKRLGRKYAQQWLTEILAGAVLMNPDASDYLNAVDLLGRFPDQSITIVDSVTAVVALRLKIQVWTFDHHFVTMQAPVWRAQA